MKNSIVLLVVFAGMVLGLAGCGGGNKVSTAKLESSFATAEAPLKADAQKAVDMIKAKDLAGAAAQLQKINARAKLSQEQRDAIKETVDALAKAISEGATKSVEKAAEQTTKDLQNIKK